MIRRRRTHPSIEAAPSAWRPSAAAFHDWVLSLPWVVECPTDGSRSGVRLFAVDCEPLDRRQLLLVTGLDELRFDDSDDDASVGVAAIMPATALRRFWSEDWIVHPASPLPAGDVLVALMESASSGHRDFEALVLVAYCLALS